MGERIKEHGLNLLCTPGNDLVATTTLGCAGCQWYYSQQVEEHHLADLFQL